jgi:hypothetical protein
MKKTIITLLLFLSVSINAQSQFQGTWQSETSSYKTIIIASEYAILKVFNYSFEENHYIEEDIIEQDDNKFTTFLYNPINGYEVTINYYIKNNQLVSNFNGDFNGTVILYKK